MTSDNQHYAPTMSGQALAALRRYPARVAFSSESGTMRFAAALDLIGRMQAVLSDLDLAPRSIVGILSDNSAESWCASIAAQALGVGVTWLHPKASASDQAFQLADSGAACMVVDAIGHGVRGATLRAALDRSIRMLAIGPADFAPDLLAAADARGGVTARDLATPDDIALIHYTGGTTGRSKGVVRSHRAAAAFAGYAPLADWEWPATPRYLGIAPNSHAAGTLIIPILRLGGSAHLLRSFDVEQVAAVISRERINMSFFVPSMIYALLDAPKLSAADLSSLEVLFYGAAPMSPARLIEGLDRLGPIFAQGYGQTECLPISVLRRADHDPSSPERLVSCGFPACSCEVRLLDEEGHPVPHGDPGEICVRSPAAFDAYLNLPEQTAATLAGGWLHTGDIARQDEEGYLYIVDRKKDMIITGGFNVYSREVEDALGTHEAVAVSAVIGLPDARWGEAVTAFVVLRPNCTCTAGALIQHVKAQKGPVQAPKRVEFVADLPMTSVGKIDKKALRARLRDPPSPSNRDGSHV